MLTLFPLFLLGITDRLCACREVVCYWWLPLFHCSAQLIQFADYTDPSFLLFLIQAIIENRTGILFHWIPTGRHVGFFLNISQISLYATEQNHFTHSECWSGDSWNQSDIPLGFFVFCWSWMNEICIGWKDGWVDSKQRPKLWNRFVQSLCFCMTLLFFRELETFFF